MIVIPAIDIRGGKVVRLAQGRADLETVYSHSPIEGALRWASAGAELIHVVDLDGALTGNLKNLDIVERMVRQVKVKIELGGGIRDEGGIRDALDAGIDKVVIGTKALDKQFLKDISGLFKDNIIIGVDARAGYVYTNGWLSETKILAVELIKRIAEFGLKTVNYTDISKDGMLEGPNMDSLKSILKVARVDIIISGGISTIEDVKNMKVLEKDGLKGMIIGKALYEDMIDLKEAISICSQKE